MLNFQQNFNLRFLIKKQRNKSFTLIELLVVVSIIGLISSIILVSLGGAREKAKLAKVLQFSQSVFNALGSEAVGIWYFENNLNDSSGYGNDGTWENTGGPAPAGNFKCANVDKENTPSGQGCSLEFNGSTNYVEITDSSSLESTTAITIEAWIYPEPPHQGSSYGGIINNINGSANSRLLVHPDGKLLAQVIIGGAAQNVWGGTVQTTNNVWNHIVYVYNGSQEVWYVNGKRGTPADKTGSVNTGSSNRTISWGYTSSSYYHFKGSIDNFRIYGSALSAGQIQKVYVEGLPRHSLVKLPDK